jgi:hypothetical protein
MRMKVKSYSRLPRVTISVATVLGVVAVLFLGCAPKPKIPLEDRTPGNVMECALENQLEYETLACLLNLKLQGDQGKLSGTVEFFYRRPDTFSLYPRTFLGIGGFRAMGEGDSLTIYFPRRNEYYRGSFSDFEGSGLWAWGISLEMLLDVILGKGGLSVESAEYAGKAKDLFRYEIQEEDWIREYWIDSKRCRLARSRWTEQTGGDFYLIEYRNFTAHDGAEIPREIRIETGANDSARLKFLERKFDSPIPSKRFQIDIPADAERVTFQTHAD